MTNELINSMIRLLTPVGSPFLALLIPLIVGFSLKKHSGKRTFLHAAAAAGAYLVLHDILRMSNAAGEWLDMLISPIYAVINLLIYPAIYLRPDAPGRRLLYTASFIIAGLMAASLVISGITLASSTGSFNWFIINPSLLAAGLVSVMILLQPLLSLNAFRRTVRITCLLLLIYGGFTLRSDLNDFNRMQERRTKPGSIMNISETVPVMRTDTQLTYLPAAPCRFSKDGGYIQGCNLELFQRFLQVDYRKIQRNEPSEVSLFGMILAALLSFTIISFIFARWFCGWLCPLSTLGSILNFIRSKLGISPIRPGQSAKTLYLASGAGIAGIGMAMAAVYPYIDAQGKFAGTKIPIFPFCKLCPSQQLCPVAAGGISAYPPLPGHEWAGGFFRYGCLIIIGLYLVSFASARRIWCRFCPMGMISGIFNRGGLFTLRKDAAKCNSCGVCTEVCPMDIRQIRDEMKNTNVSTYHCLVCLKCVEKCPKDGCLSLEHSGIKVTESRFGT